MNDAAGVVSVQAGCTIAEALAVLESRATTFGQPLEDLAAAVVERRIRFGAPCRR